MLRPRLNWPWAALRLWCAAIHNDVRLTGGREPSFFAHFCGAVFYDLCLRSPGPGGVTGPLTEPLGPSLETRTALQYSAGHCGGPGRAGARSCRAHVPCSATQQDIEFVLTFAFIPARYDTSAVLGGVLPGGFGAQLWTFVTYSLIHADWTHLGVNAVWLLPFGSAVARRFGAARFLAFFAVTAAAGAAMHLATHAGEQSPVIGASAAISGTMAAAMRFAFQRGGPLGFWRQSDDAAYRVPAIPLAGVLRDPRVLAFLAVWFGINILFGLGSFPLTGMGAKWWPGRRISAAFSPA